MFEAHPEKGPMRRLLGRRSNELRRAADRTRSRWLVVFAFSPFIAVLCAIAIGTAVRNTQVRAARAEALHLHQVSATTVGEADRALPARVNAQMATAPASWQYPASQRHTDTVLVPAGTAVGGTVTVWVDDAGRKASAPRLYGELASTAAAAGARGHRGTCSLRRGSRLAQAPPRRSAQSRWVGPRVGSRRATLVRLAAPGTGSRR